MPATRAARTTVRRTLALAAALPVLAFAATACGYGSQATDDQQRVAAEGKKIDGLDEIKVGYFDNVTHETPLVGLQEVFFQGRSQQVRSAARTSRPSAARGNGTAASALRSRATSTRPAASPS